MQMVIENDCLTIRGMVSVQTLTRQDFKQFVQLCQQPEVHALDLSGVVRADSACISLLLTALRENVSGSLKWVNVPESVRTLAALYELPTLDEWQQASEG
ncbi:STAS domain-containing protein [Alysiella crassa]|uniref:Predicted NTP binding protein (Contains STAS domain) n=1 Tax=Alysiella crassa TaxID=153491 RepID=A0A376BS31_9NEIS|nr:STAS domain-containing protein [Alysiella crassa]UOP07829.1 STAS domain-containing protein [Alysiella crassa]SSY79661.1 Predicted NTP binding protein (contains STAS domain) [Alysiella crassa]